MALAAPASIDAALAVRRYLAAQPDCIEALGPPTEVDSPWDTWLFTRELAVVVENAVPNGAGAVAGVVSVEGPWTLPNRHNTARFPRVIVTLYADGTRTDGKLTVRDAEARAWVAWHPIDLVLHRMDAFSEIWGARPDETPPDPGLRVWGSQRIIDPIAFSIQDWVGGIRLRSEYGLNTG
jgi:hypothetical protein